MPRSVAYIIGYLLIIPTALWHGWVGAWLWHWFVPFEVPMLMRMMTGISLMVHLFYPKPILDRDMLGGKREGFPILQEIVFNRIVVPAMVLGVGWILFKVL